MSTTYYGTLDSTPVNLTVQPGQAFPTDRQGTLVEIDALPAGATVDKIFYFSSPTSGKYLKRVINGKMRAAELGIYPSNTGAVNSTILNAAFSNAGINEIVFDYGSNVDVEIVFNGTIDGMGKKMTIRKGTILDAGSAATLLTNITIEAPNDLRIFGDSIKTDYIKTVNGEVSVAWWGPAGDGTAPDHTKINKALSVGSCPVVNFKSPVPGKVYYIETALTVPANKILRFGNNDRLKWNNNTLVNFEGKVEADYNAYIFDSTGGRFKTGVSSNDEWSVKWFGAKGDEDNVTDDTQALKNAEAAASNRITSNETISTLYFPKGTYRADNVAYRTNIRGAGESSRLMAYTAGAYAVILDAADGYPVGSPAWDFKHIKDLTIVGDSSQLRNGITFGSKEGINPQNA
ncbi:MAG TPA: glycosyl hydrolase family 28-related protein, partial [Chitinophaga sp.]